MDKRARRERLRTLLRSGRKHKFSKGELIQSTADDRQHLNFIESGFVKRYLIENDGTLGVQYIDGPGDIFPLTFAFKTLLQQDLYKGPEVYYYEAMNRVVVYSIDGQALVEGVAADPLLYSDLFSEAGERIGSSIQLLENKSLRTSYKRVAHQLAFFAREFGEKSLMGTKIKMPLTQQDLADILSTSRETVSLSMVHLRERKLIKTGRSIVVPSLKKLLDEAYS